MTNSSSRDKEVKVSLEESPLTYFESLHGTPIGETDIYRQWLEGDELAWEKLVEAYTPMIYQFCLQFTQQPGLAEEYTQEIFLKLFRNLPHLAHHTNLKRWLMRTAYHYCIDQHRRQKHERQYLRNLWLEVKTRLKGSQQEALAEKADERRIILEALKLLPPDLRGVIVLREFLELAYDDIASTLQIPVGTVKSRLNRARHLLLQHIRQVTAKYDNERTQAIFQSLWMRFKSSEDVDM